MISRFSCRTAGDAAAPVKSCERGAILIAQFLRDTFRTLQIANRRQSMATKAISKKAISGKEYLVSESSQ
jgi:hypothetical protein